MALAGVAGCKAAPPEKIVPYVRPPEEILPGMPLYYATAMPVSGYAIGLIVKSHEGRPSKVEGNPDHPASLGADRCLRSSLVVNALRSGSRTNSHGERADWHLGRLHYRSAATTRSIPLQWRRSANPHRDRDVPHICRLDEPGSRRISRIAMASIRTRQSRQRPRRRPYDISAAMSTFNINSTKRT